MHSFDRERQTRLMGVVALLPSLSPDQLQAVEVLLRAAQPATVSYEVYHREMVGLGCPRRLIRTIWYRLVQDMESEARWLLGQERQPMWDGKGKEAFVRRCLATPLPVSVLLKATYVSGVGTTTWGYFEKWRKGLVV